jgi:crotonobetainyl-CoA:carnitine CoA-transferase CaiB-like acyl-CoA transferase
MKPFEGISVLDLTQSVAGPICTQMLGALGADVVKIEPPQGEVFRSTLEGAFFASFNLGGKQSISVDMKTAEGQSIAEEIAEMSDVIVENYRPGVMAQFNLDYETVAEENDDVVYCSISGFGDSGPYRDYTAFDPVVQAMSGLMARTGYSDRPPVRIGASVIDCGTGFNAAFLIASALFDRRETGEGQYIETSLFDVALSWMGYWIAHYTATGTVPERSGTRFQGIAPYDIYNDGEDDALFLGAINQKLFERLCRVIDREDLVDDDRFATNSARWDNQDSLREELEGTFSEFTRDEIVELLADEGIPVGPLNHVEELVESDPHVEAREILTDSYNHYRDTPVKTSTVPFRTGDGERIRLDENPPAKGEHSRVILSKMGFSDEEIDTLFEGDIVFE